MDIEAKKENLCINEIEGQKTENIIVEGDCIIPDIKPDILNSINVDGIVCIYKKEILDGKIKLEGAINSNIIYLADNEESGIRGFSTNIDFSKTIEMKNAKSDMLMECEINLKNIECKVLNGRKVNVKSVLEVSIKLFVNNNIEFIENITNIDDMQKLNKSFSMNSVLGSGETRCFAKDTVLIDNIDNLAEIMKTNVKIINKETKISYNKILIKADLSVKILYLTEDNRINVVKTNLPIMGFIDIQNISDDNICDVKFSLKNFVVKPNNVEEHSIYLEAEIEINCNVYENKKIEIIEDLYSPSVNLNPDYLKLTTMQGKKHIEDICNIRHNQNISELKNEKIYDSDVNINILKQNIMNDRVIFEGEIEISFIFSSNKTGWIDNKKIIIPFNHNIEIEGINKESKISTKIDVIMQDFVIMPDESIDIKIDLNFLIDCFNNINISVINSINISESKNQDIYSIIIYFVKPGDTLWNIAKKFKSTVQNILTINEIDDENKINVGDELFIPRYVKRI